MPRKAREPGESSSAFKGEIKKLSIIRREILKWLSMLPLSTYGEYVAFGEPNHGLWFKLWISQGIGGYYPMDSVHQVAYSLSSLNALASIAWKSMTVNRQSIKGIERINFFSSAKELRLVESLLKAQADQHPHHGRH